MNLPKNNEIGLSVIQEALLQCPSPAFIYSPTTGELHPNQLTTDLLIGSGTSTEQLVSALASTFLSANARVAELELFLQRTNSHDLVELSVKVINIANGDEDAVYLIYPTLTESNLDRIVARQMNQVFQRINAVGYFLEYKEGQVVSCDIYGNAYDLFQTNSSIDSEQFSTYLLSFPEVRDLVASSQNGTIEIEYKIPGMPGHWVRNIIKVTFNGNGTAELSGTIRDISEQVQAEKRARSLMEAAHESIWEGIYDMANQRWILGAVNSTFTETSGLETNTAMTLDQIVGLVHPEDQERARTAYLSIADRTQSSIELDLRLLRADGSYYPAHLYMAAAMQLGSDKLSLVGSIMDLSDHQRAMDFERSLRTFMEQTPYPVMITDSNQNLIFANPATLGIFRQFMPDLGVNEIAAMFEQPTESLDLPPGVVAIRKIFDEVLHSQVASQQQYTVDFGNNNVRIFDVSATAGEYEGRSAFFISVRDITDLIEEARERERLAAEIEMRKGLDIARRQGMIHVIHGFKTPLSIINTSLYILGKGDEARRAQKIAIITEQVQRLTAMTDDMLEAGRRAATGQIEVNPVPVDFRTELDRVIKNYDGNFQHQLVIDIADGDYAAVSDPNRIWDVLDNLMSNAHKYSPKGGEVSVRMWRESESIAISISDEGIGIKEADLTYIFEPFYRTAEADLVARGSGVGLWTCKTMMEALGGIISCSSELGKGTTFTVRFPLAQAA